MVVRIGAAGWGVGNVDVVIAAAQPRLAPHVGEISALLASTIGGAVSVKPKRTEGVGAIGRGEGIAAWAVALLTGRESDAAT